MSDFLGQLDQWSALWCECLWRATLQGGIAIAAAWAITHCCHFLSARVRCWIWRMAVPQIAGRPHLEPASRSSHAPGPTDRTFRANIRGTGRAFDSIAPIQTG